MQCNESDGKRLDCSDDVLERWRSSRAVLLLLREELQQVRDFIDGLRARQTQSTRLNQLGDLEHRVRRGFNGLCNMDKALRLVCDRLDVLVIVCDAVLHGHTALLFAANDSDVSAERLSDLALMNKAELETNTEEDEGDCVEYVRLRDENRKLFDDIVDMMRQIDDTGVQHLAAEDVPDLESRFQAQPAQVSTDSKQHGEELADTDHISEADSSHESNYRTCDESSVSVSPNGKPQSTLEEIWTKVAPTASEPYLYSRSDISDQVTEAAVKGSDMWSKTDAKVSDELDVFVAEEQTYRSATELEKSLLQMQQRANVLLHHELVQLLEENRELQCIAQDLRTSLDLKNNDIVTLTSKVDHYSRLLDEQLEEFRCVFRAVARENEEEVDRLATENDRLKYALKTLNTRGDFIGQVPGTKQLSERNTSSCAEACQANVKESSTAELTEYRERRHEKVSLGQGLSLPRRLEAKLDTADGWLPVLDRCEPDAHLFVPVKYVEELWSEIDALKETVLEQSKYVAKTSDKRKVSLPATDWNDSGAVVYSSDTTVYDETDVDGLESWSCSTPALLSREPFHAVYTGYDSDRDHQQVKSEEKQTQKPSTRLNISRNEVQLDKSLMSLSDTSTPIVFEQPASHLPHINVSRRTRNCLSQSLSDSCLTAKSCASCSYDCCQLRSCDTDSFGGLCESGYHRCFGDYLQTRCPKQENGTRSPVTSSTEWQQPNNSDGDAESQTKDELFEIREQETPTMCAGDIIDLYSSLKSELQRFREIIAGDDLDIIDKRRAEEFSASDLTFIMARFKYHVQQKLILDEENCLLSEEIGRLLSKLLGLERIRLPIITENSVIADDSKPNYQGEHHDTHLLDSTFTEKIEDFCDRKHSDCELADCANGVHGSEPFEKCSELYADLSSGTQSMPCMCSKYIEISIKQAPTSGEGQNEKTNTIESPPNIGECDRQARDLDVGFVPKSCVGLLESSTERKSLRSSLCDDCSSSISSLNTLRSSPCMSTGGSSPLGDLVTLLRQQNTKLASYVSVVNSFFRQSPYNQTLRNSHQLETTVFELSDCTTTPANPVQGRDCPVNAIPLFLLAAKTSPFMALSAVCLPRPLAIDLTTVADSDMVTCLRGNSR